MTKESNTQKPLLIQIYDEMFRNIEESQKFNEEEIQNLKKLAYQDNFKKERSIIDAIKLGEKAEK